MKIQLNIYYDIAQRRNKAYNKTNPSTPTRKQYREKKRKRERETGK